MKNELLKVIDMDQTKEFAEVLKVVALEYDRAEKMCPEVKYGGYAVLKFFVSKYIKEPLGFSEEEWDKEVWNVKPLEVKPITSIEGIVKSLEK